jgi:hypothetical protein
LAGFGGNGILLKMLRDVTKCRTLREFLSSPNGVEINIRVFERILRDDMWHGGGSGFSDREFDFTAEYAEIAEKKPRFWANIPRRQVDRLWALMRRKIGKLCGGCFGERRSLYIYGQRVKVLLVFSGFGRILGRFFVASV